MKLTALAAVAVLALAGCGGISGTQSTVKTGTNRPAETSTTTPVIVPETTDAPTADYEPTIDSNEPITFGGTKTYTDGLSITVSAPVRFKPSSESAIMEPAKAYVKFTVTLVNGTGKMFDPSMVSATVQSANIEGSNVFDSNVGGSPSTKLLKGREVKYVVAFGVDDPKDIVMEITPGFDYESAMFTN